MCKPRLKATAQVLELVLNARPHSTENDGFALDVGRSDLEQLRPESGHSVGALMAAAPRLMSAALGSGDNAR